MLYIGGIRTDCLSWPIIRKPDGKNYATTYGRRAACLIPSLLRVALCFIAPVGTDTWTFGG